MSGGNNPKLFRFWFRALFYYGCHRATAKLLTWTNQKKGKYL